LYYKDLGRHRINRRGFLKIHYEKRYEKAVSQRERNMRGYYLHKRGSVYYAELVDKRTGLKLTARSTRERDRDAALLVVAGWLKDRLPNPPAEETPPRGGGL